ncbi:hypothetical protein [Devosia sp. CN2-171]|uniref:hypothetical protein n=1 Tax=Devosia sp. CN2-171 TaxID=3400909 RepID=UPI003BF8036F
MAKLALAVEEERQLGPDRVSFRITSRAGQVAQRAFGETIIVYQRAGNLVLFMGSGRALVLEHAAAGFNRLTLSDYRAFAVPVPSDAEGEVRDPGVRRNLSLEDARFEEILHLATAADIGAQALAEANAVFAVDRQNAIDAYLKVHDRVLLRWKYRCVFTGAQFEPSETRPHPDLRVVALRPRELGGQLHVRNYLPMVAEAEHAWTHGHMALGPSLGFLVSERLIDPEFRERLLPSGKLSLAEEPSFWPDSEAVAYHRANIFDRD